MPVVFELANQHLAGGKDRRHRAVSWGGSKVRFIHVRKYWRFFWCDFTYNTLLRLKYRFRIFY